MFTNLKIKIIFSKQVLGKYGVEKKEGIKLFLFERILFPSFCSQETYKFK